MEKLDDLQKENIQTTKHIQKTNKYKKTKTNLLRTFLIICLLETFFAIFGFSSQDAKESSGLSRQVTNTVTKNVKSIQRLEKSQKEIVLSKIEKIVRKIAHFSIYTLVGILLMALFSTYNMKERNRIILSLVIGIIYASSDEIHQRFVSGRSGQITDVMIDSFGVLFGILIVMLVMECTRRICSKHYIKSTKFWQNYWTKYEKIV